MVNENIFSTPLNIYNTVPPGTWPNKKSNNNNSKLTEKMMMNWYQSIKVDT